MRELEGGLQKYPVTDNMTVSAAREMIQALPKARGNVLAVGAVYSASLAMEAVLLVLGLRCGEKRLLLPFLFHSLVDILLVLAAGGSLAAGLFLSSGVVTGVMMGVAVGGVVFLSFLLWRSSLLAYRTIQPHPKEDRIVQLASAPLQSQELLPLHGEKLGRMD